MKISKEELLAKIKHWYNGYSWDGKTFVYNPFSTLSFFDNKRFKGYWFSTGTPTFLIEQIKKKDNLESFVEEQTVMEDVLSAFAAEEVETTALLFQTGYLTIKNEEDTSIGVSYTIDFPNFEVKNAFLTSLLKTYIGKDINEVQTLRTKLIKALESKDSISLEETLKSLYANIPYNLHIGKEAYYHSLFILTCRLAGFEVDGEVHTNKGRIDAVLKKDKTVVIVEIKYSKDNKLEEMLIEAILQIRNNNYYEKYSNNNPTLLAIVFSENKHIACRFA
jgi:hypothetical protein